MQQKMKKMRKILVTRVTLSYEILNFMQILSKIHYYNREKLIQLSV